MKRVFALLLALVATLMVSAPMAWAQTTPTSPTAPVPAATAPPPATAPLAPLSGADALSYRLGPGDKLRVTTFNEPTLTGEFFVGGDGVVSLPLVGDIKAANLTVAAFRDQFQGALKAGYLKDPRVSVEVLTYRPFYVLGEVTRPGEYAYTNGLTVLNAVATASGFTYRAQTKKVFIRHQSETEEREYPMSSSTVIQPGDTIRVAERFF